MTLRPLLALALLMSAAPLAGERLQFDHRLYPPLQQVLDSGDKAMIDFNANNPRRLVDLIAVKGTSVHNWTEALEIVSIPRPRDRATARDWLTLLQKQGAASCKSEFTVLAEDDNSITFERLSPACPGEPVNTAICRLVAGKRSWFELAVLVKGSLDSADRAKWLALLASAHLD